MTLDDAVADLKQFIVSVVGQEAMSLRAELRADLWELDDKLSGKIDDLSASIAEAMAVNSEVVDDQLQDHEVRIKQLEHKVA